MHVGSSWVEAMEAFTGMTKVVKASGLEEVIWEDCRQISVLKMLMSQNLSQPIRSE